METEVPQRPDTEPRGRPAAPRWKNLPATDELLKYEKRARTAMTLVLVGFLVPLCMLIGWVMGLTVINKIPPGAQGKSQAQVAVFLPLGIIVVAILIIVVTAASGS